MEQEQDALSAVVNWLKESSEVVFLTGSELSMESGIPDVSSFDFNPDIRKFKNKNEVREKYWSKIKDIYPKISSAAPNAAHNAIYEISLLTNVNCILTQCSDGLHQKAGNENVIDIYASIHWVTCPDCGKDQTMIEALSQLEKGSHIPRCPVCSNDQVKPPISFPGQAFPHWEVRESWMRLQHCDLLIIVGANLDNEPVASFPFQVMNNEKNVVIISEAESPADEFVSAVIYGKPSMVMPYLADELKKQTPIS